MIKKDKIILFIISLVIIVPILLNEIKEYNLKMLKKEAFEISELLKNSSSFITQVNINKKIIINDKIYKTRGIGKAFSNEEDVIVILSYGKYCAVKSFITNDVALSKSKCPSLELINNTIIPIVSKDGLIKQGENYFYKGESDNYIIFNDEYWRILSFENKSIKIVKNNPIKVLSKNDYSDYLNNYLNNLIKKNNFDVSHISIDNEITYENTKYIEGNIGILSLEDYLNTLNDKCTIKNTNLICSKSFMTKDMWLSNYNDSSNSYYVYNDGNIYIDNNSEKKGIYPVLVLEKNTKITSGDGTKNNPYKID